ncbi:MAG: GNAT family N-acetyltransferase [Candidatus Hadarchaeum sp.]|uniref:GNAT family N-acetyltransferase n=1 Tax=Candidatus Hadarchaeum sp. TaxID=2883567 RepID=UPI00317ADFBB
MQIEHTMENGVHRYECWDDYGCSVVGFAVVVEKRDFVYLKEINVGSSHRGLGIGTALLRRVIEDFSGRDLFASVFKERVNWYQRHGFETLGDKDGLTEIKRTNRDNLLK